MPSYEPAGDSNCPEPSPAATDKYHRRHDTRHRTACLLGGVADTSGRNFANRASGTFTPIREFFLKEVYATSRVLKCMIQKFHNEAVHGYPGAAAAGSRLSMPKFC
jgi:hypothetical protein